MANTSSAKKAVRKTVAKRKINLAKKSLLNTSVKKLTRGVTAKSSKPALKKLLSESYKNIDKAAKRKANLISPNKAARMKSKLAKKLNK